MPDQWFQVPYSKTVLEFKIPPTMQADVAASRSVEPLQDISRAIQECAEAGQNQAQHQECRRHQVSQDPDVGVGKVGQRIQQQQ